MLSRLLLTALLLFPLCQTPALGQITAEPPAVAEPPRDDSAVATNTEPADDAAASQAIEEKSKYLRILRNDRETPIAMQTSIVTFRGKPGTKYAGVQVDLIGAVHVADAKYFDELEREFLKYDALLYELVAPEESNVPLNGESQHPVGQMQQGMKSMLDLSFQLEEIDYTKKNFVHADMSPEEFARVMQQRGESFLQMMLRTMGQAIAMQNARGSSDADLLLALFAPDRSLRLKRVMSTQFEDLEGAMSAIEGPNGSTIIGQRNRKCLEFFEREAKLGKKTIGIFYGAGHMPDMAKRLTRDFEMVNDPKSTKWLTAWDMK